MLTANPNPNPGKLRETRLPHTLATRNPPLASWPTTNNHTHHLAGHDPRQTVSNSGEACVQDRLRRSRDRAHTTMPLRCAHLEETHTIAPRHMLRICTHECQLDIRTLEGVDSQCTLLHASNRSPRKDAIAKRSLGVEIFRRVKRVKTLPIFIHLWHGIHSSTLDISDLLASRRVRFTVAVPVLDLQQHRFSGLELHRLRV
jgi:hypothetical protein